MGPATGTGTGRDQRPNELPWQIEAGQSSTHYFALREPLNAGLKSSLKCAQAASARQICLAALVDENAECDAAQVRNGNPVMRSAAAEVYACNLGDATVSKLCTSYLHQLFEDQSEEVREAASRCFLYIGDKVLRTNEPLIDAYIDSPAFPASHDVLLGRLEDSTWQLPELTIRLAETFLRSVGSDAANISNAAFGHAPTVSKLVIRLYSQSSDRDVQLRCLDLIDKMELLGFYGIDLQLAEHDR